MYNYTYVYNYKKSILQKKNVLFNQCYKWKISSSILNKMLSFFISVTPYIISLIVKYQYGIKVLYSNLSK